MPIVHPSLLSALTPAADSADVIDADLYTSAGKAVTVYADGSYMVQDDDGSLPLQFFWVRLFDDSTGDWHVQSPFRVWLGGIRRMPSLVGNADDVKAALQALGLAVQFEYDRSDAVDEGDVISANYLQNDLVDLSQIVTLVVSSEAPALYAEQFTRLLPRGALATALSSTLRKLWLGVTAELQRVYQRARTLLREAHALTTDELLHEWEAEYGLPEPCITVVQTVEERRNAVIGRMAGVGGCSRAYFIDLAARMGITIAIVEEHAFEVGRDGAGMGIGGDEWSFTWSVYAPPTTSVAQRQLLECVFDRINQAHLAVQFFYE